MGKSSITRKDKKEGIKPGAHSMNPDRKVGDQKKGNNVSHKCEFLGQFGFHGRVRQKKSGLRITKLFADVDLRILAML